MIRWKQADIHRKRRAEKDDLAAVKRELRVIDVFVKNCEEDLSNFESGRCSVDEIKRKSSHRYSEIVNNLDKQYEEEISKDRDYRWGPPTPDKFVMAHVDPSVEINNCDDENIVEKIQSQIKALQKRREELLKYVSDAEEKSAKKITFDDLSTGYNKTIISEKVVKNDDPNDVYKGEDINVDNIYDEEDVEPDNIENLSEEDLKNVFSSDFDQDIECITNPEARKISKISDAYETKEFMINNPSIINDKCADMILTEAFKLRMLDKPEESKLCVRQSLLLRYVCLMPKNSLDKTIDVFLNSDKDTSEFFRRDVEKSFEKIEERVKKLKEKKERTRETVCKYVDSLRREDGSYPAPKKGDNEDEETAEKRAKLFDTLPHDLQRTLILRDTQKLNEYLSTLSVEEGERLLKEWNSVNLITIDNSTFDDASDDENESSENSKSNNVQSNNNPVNSDNPIGPTAVEAHE